MFSREVSDGYDPVIVILSDGSATDAPTALHYVSQSWPRVIAVGVGPDVNAFTLSKLASKPVHEHFIYFNGESRWSVAQKMAAMICPGWQ